MLENGSLLCDRALSAGFTVCRYHEASKEASLFLRDVFRTDTGTDTGTDTEEMEAPDNLEAKITKDRFRIMGFSIRNKLTHPLLCGLLDVLSGIS